MYVCVCVCDVLTTVSFTILCTFNMHTLFREDTILKYSSDSEAEKLKSVPLCTTDSISKAITAAQVGCENTV